MYVCVCECACECEWERVSERARRWELGNLLTPAPFLPGIKWGEVNKVVNGYPPIRYRGGDKYQWWRGRKLWQQTPVCLGFYVYTTLQRQPNTHTQKMEDPSSGPIINAGGEEGVWKWHVAIILNKTSQCLRQKGKSWEEYLNEIRHGWMNQWGNRGIR